jgi:hypothetical protein
VLDYATGFASLCILSKYIESNPFHFAEPVRQNFTALCSKHAVQCANGDASNTSLIIIHGVEQRGLLLHKVKLYVNFC